MAVLLFDPDSKNEYRLESDGNQGPPYQPVAREIFAELVVSKQRTIGMFEDLCDLRAQLARFPEYQNDQRLRDAETIRSCAWANYRIHNYYDSARLMGEALRIVRNEVDRTVAKVQGHPRSTTRRRSKPVVEEASSPYSWPLPDRERPVSR